MTCDYSIIELCEVLLPLIAQTHRESRQTYDSPRITRWFHERGHRCGRRRIGRLMKANGLSHRMPTLQPDAVWVANITYVPTLEGWLYVAALIGRCTRRCIRWAMDDSLVHHSDRGVQYASAAYQ